ncbi:hypothetical protein GR927_22965 [Mycolicibacterium sp. 3033]|nr:hypothetical protein [Mycolicibacterium aurantiacum]
MPRSKTARNKARKQRGPTAAKPGPPHILTSQRKRMKSFFAVVFEICAAADDILATIPRPSDEDEARLLVFDACMLIRGLNALKSARLLCEEAHWEFATGAVRQLFELVINMEHLATYDDRTDGTFKYAKYGLMQWYERERDELAYGKRTGRVIDEERLLALEDALENTFPEFRSRTAKGRLDRKHYWSGRTVRKLAEESPNPMRSHHYDLLFTPYSEETHAAPSVLIAAMFPGTRSRDEFMASDSVRIVETLMMGVNFFFELWALLPHVPQVPAEQQRAWISALLNEAQEFGTWPESGTTEHATSSR